MGTTFKTGFGLGLILWFLPFSGGSQNLPVVPQVQQTEFLEGTFSFSGSDQSAVDSLILRSPDFGRGTGRIRIETGDPGVIKKSGYSILISNKGIRIESVDPAGTFYGLQTVKQLLAAEPDRNLRCVRLTDYPVFAWRGLMLDCSRTFLSREYILGMIDRLAEVKMNVLHLHLTDDQGWRIEIRKYPALTDICSKFDPKFPGEVNGFYTQEDIREMVAYAASRFVTLVPEIEMPGHSSEIFAAYPHLSCSGEKSVIFPFFQGPPITEQILCAGNESVFRFLEDVLTEVFELFPSAYIHIGGDEAPKTAWKSCPKCQARMKSGGMKTEEQLQSYFVGRMGKFIESHGRKMIGWDEILEGGLPRNAAVMSWRGTRGGIEAAEMGHTVVMSPTSHCYFDYSMETTPVQKVYEYLPVPSELHGDKASLILGAQANMWTHIARNPEEINRQIFPRLYALAEVVWTHPKERNFNDFSDRIKIKLTK